MNTLRLENCKKCKKKYYNSLGFVCLVLARASSRFTVRVGEALLIKVQVLYSKLSKIWKSMTVVNGKMEVNSQSLSTF